MKPTAFRNGLTNRDMKKLFVVFLFFLFVLIVLYRADWSAVEFKDFSQSKVLELVMSMFVVSVFMERALDALLVPLRTPDRQKNRVPDRASQSSRTGGYGAAQRKRI
jgi:hypothetical protein